MMNRKRMVMLGSMFLVLVVLTGCGATTVDLNKYITIEAEGYESLGKATYTFDYEAFHKDYAEKIKLNTKNSEEMMAQGLQSSQMPDELLVDICVDQSLDQTEHLSNGDVVTLVWNCRDDIAKEYFNCNLEYSDIQYSVAGLEEAGTFNPFDYVNVQFSGTAPNGNVILTSDLNQKEMNGIQLTADKNNGLSNGDTITVTASLYCTEEDFVERFGMTLGETEKSYEVNSLAYYAANMEDVPADVIDKMVSQGEDAFRAYVARRWDKPEYLIDVSYAGNYFLTPKSDMGDHGNNRIYLVYDITAKNPEPEEEINFYYYIFFDNIMISEEGICAVDMGSYKTPTGRFKVGTYTYEGCENLDSLFNECVGEYMDQYEYISTVQG